MSVPQIYQEINDRNTDIVLSQTWGHLYPKDQQPHDGFIVFAHSAYGDISSIDSDFKDIDDSPWFFQDMMNYIGKCNTIAGNIYIFKGTYRKLKNQRAVFKGKIQKIKVSDLLTFTR